MAGVYAIAAPVLFIPGLVDLYVLPRTALAVLFGGLLLGLGLYRGAPLRGAVNRLWWPAAAVAAASVLAAATSVNLWLSLAGAYTRYESLVLRLAYLGLLLGAAGLLAGGSRSAAAGRRGVQVAFVLGCSVVSLEAVWQLVTHSVPRPDGNLGQANLLGALLAMALPLSLQAGFRFWPALATLPVLCFGLFASSSRSGWLAALAGCLVVLLTVLPARSRRLGVAAASVLGLAAVAVLVLSPLRNLNSDTGSARIGVWGDGVAMVAARPLTGWGEEATGLMFGRYQTRDWEPGDAFDRIHDEPLDLLATQGLLGLAACGWLWLMIARAGARRAVAGRGGAAAMTAGAPLGALAAYATWSVLNFDWAPATGPFWFLGGLAWAEFQAGATSLSAGLPRTTALTTAVVRRRAAGAVLALIAAALAVPPIVADRAYFTGDNSRAVALDPLQAQYHRVLGEALGHSEAGLRELKRARDLGDYDYQFFIELGDLARDLGRLDEARAAYQRAEQVYRYDPTAAERLKALGGP